MDGSSGKGALVPGTHTVEGDSIPSAVLWPLRALAGPMHTPTQTHLSQDTYVKFSALDNGLRCLFNTSELSDLQGLSASLHPYLLRGMVGISPSSTMNSAAREMGSPSPEGSFLSNPDILVLYPLILLPSWLLHLVPLSPFLFPSSFPTQPSSACSCPLRTLPDVPVPVLTMLSLSATKNLLLQFT